MKLFRIRGGVHPEDRKALAADCPIENLPPPALLHVPLQQHVGAPAEPVVRKGERVLKGQLLAVGQGAVSAPVHAPTSGRIKGIGRYPAPHPSGLPGRTIALEADGADTWAEPLAPLDPEEATPEDIAERVAACGIVGLGGATFPAAVKLDLRSRTRLSRLVINAAECEPYLTCDDRLMREQPHQVMEGIRIMARALGVETVVVAIEANKPRAAKALKAAAFPGITVVTVPTRYPMGSEKHLVQVLTGRETPAGKLTADIGVVVHNVATAFAVFEAVREGRPLISRVVTVSGTAIRRPANLRVPLGTPVQALLDHCGGFAEDPARLLAGGPMMGFPLPRPEVPIVKGTNGILALTADEAAAAPARPCVRCGTCVGVCPCGLLPLEMAARIRKEDLEGAAKAGLGDCIGCGSCAYACPSAVPLVQYFNYAKGRLAAQRRDQQKLAETKAMAEARSERLERQAKAKKEALARRKAEREAQKKAEQEAVEA